MHLLFPFQIEKSRIYPYSNDCKQDLLDIEVAVLRCQLSLQILLLSLNPFVPKSWQVLYRDDEGNFKPVNNNTPYLTEKDTFNKAGFEPVETNGVKIEIVLQDRWSAGVQEVIIE